jgi:hypothetical protein
LSSTRRFVESGFETFQARHELPVSHRSPLVTLRANSFHRNSWGWTLER